MALIIKADLPKNCYDCYIKKNWTFDYICPLMEKVADLNTLLRADCRHPSCPILGEIPDEHGRLVDADKFRKEVEAWRGCHTAIFTFVDFLALLDNAPTIVEVSR